MTKPLTLDDVLERLKGIYDDVYAFPFIEQEYQTTGSKITITCPVHGNVLKTVSSLIHRKSVCNKCSKFKQYLSDRHGYEFAQKEIIDFYKFIMNPPPLANIRDLRNYNRKSYYLNLKVLYDVYLLKIGPRGPLSKPVKL